MVGAGLDISKPRLWVEPTSVVAGFPRILRDTRSWDSPGDFFFLAALGCWRIFFPRGAGIARGSFMRVRVGFNLLRRASPRWCARIAPCADVFAIGWLDLAKDPRRGGVEAKEAAAFFFCSRAACWRRGHHLPFLSWSCFRRRRKRWRLGHAWGAPLRARLLLISLYGRRRNPYVPDFWKRGGAGIRRRSAKGRPVQPLFLLPHISQGFAPWSLLDCVAGWSRSRWGGLVGPECLTRYRRGAKAPTTFRQNFLAPLEPWGPGGDVLCPSKRIDRFSRS